MNTTQKQPLGYANLSNSASSQMELWTNDQLSTFDLANCENIPNAISLQVSEDGVTPCSLLDGRKTSLCGREVVLASHSVVLESKMEIQMSATCGRYSLISSMNAALNMSLANKLRVQLPMDGLMASHQIWKQKSTPAGRLYWEHTLLRLRTNGKGSIGLLPTPTAREGRDRSRCEVLAKLDNGTGVAKRICNLSPITRSLKEIVGLNPFFALWMMGYPKEWGGCHGAGNAIVPQVAAEFIKACEEAITA